MTSVSSVPDSSCNTAKNLARFSMMLHYGNSQPGHVFTHNTKGTMYNLTPMDFPGAIVGAI